MSKRRKTPKIRAQSLQVSVRVIKPTGVRIHKSLLQQAVNRFLDTGEMPKGMQITAIVWDKQFAGGREGSKTFLYEDPEEFHTVLTKARQIGIWPPVFSDGLDA